MADRRGGLHRGPRGRGGLRREPQRRAHAQAKYHQLMRGIDPWRVKGDPASGLLPGIQPGGRGGRGPATRRVQPTTSACASLTGPKTGGLGRSPRATTPSLRGAPANFEAGETRAPWNPILMPNRKTDVNNNFEVLHRQHRHELRLARAD
jgi:hypothetical protein